MATTPSYDTLEYWIWKVDEFYMKNYSNDWSYRAFRIREILMMSLEYMDEYPGLAKHICDLISGQIDLINNFNYLYTWRELIESDDLNS